MDYSEEKLVPARAYVIVPTLLVLGCVSAATGATTSYTGTFATPEDVLTQVINVAVDGTVTLQTYGFGGGLNSVGASIPAGGFDSFVALFSGTGDGATLIDGTSDALSNYGPTVAGCPPAGLVTIGSIPGQCGDVRMSFTVTSGTYTVLLSDGLYIPNAIFGAGTTLGDGFSDLTGSIFQTCVDASNCNNDTGNWALDITSLDTTASSAPEPSTYGLVALMLSAFVLCTPVLKNRLKGRI